MTGSEVGEEASDGCYVTVRDFASLQYTLISNNIGATDR